MDLLVFTSKSLLRKGPAAAGGGRPAGRPSGRQAWLTSSPGQTSIRGICLQMQANPNPQAKKKIIKSGIHLLINFFLVCGHGVARICKQTSATQAPTGHGSPQAWGTSPQQGFACKLKQIQAHKPRETLLKVELIS